MPGLRIIHISDLHLFKTADGYTRQIVELHWGVHLLEGIAQKVGAFLRRLPMLGDVGLLLAALPGGFETHSEEAWLALQKTLSNLTGAGCDSPNPVVIVQTGDISAFGALLYQKDKKFPEWELWNGKVRPKYDTCDWIDLFGNHDLWPGALPLFIARATKRVIRTFRKLYFPDRYPLLRNVDIGDVSFEIYSVNSVSSSAFVNTFAIGDVSTDLPKLGKYKYGGKDPLREISRLAQEASDRKRGLCTIRILAMHHPPHAFKRQASEGRSANLFVEGLLVRAEELSAWLTEQQSNTPFHLVIAGHRHAVDPKTLESQPPLPHSVRQLVCGSATQHTSAGEPPPSFSVYDFEWGSNGPGSNDANIKVTRTVYEYSGAFDALFEKSTKTDPLNFEIPLYVH